MIKRKINLKSKRGQEEMVGFALIILVIAVVLLVFLVVTIKNSKEEFLGANEVGSFIQASLSYTTNCAEDSSYYSIQELIMECVNYESNCEDGRKTCDVLNETIESLLEESWKITENSAIIGYDFYITVNEQPVIFFEKGNSTLNYKGSIQNFPHYIDVSLNVYY